jgi:hypothetical protein
MRSAHTGKMEDTEDTEAQGFEGGEDGALWGRMGTATRR